MSRFRERPFSRLALIGALAVSLGLAACGRKGPLDPPPGASLATQPQAQNQDTTATEGPRPIGGRATDNNAGIGPNGRPVAPQGPNKRIPLDVLLN